MCGQHDQENLAAFLVLHVQIHTCTICNTEGKGWRAKGEAKMSFFFSLKKEKFVFSLKQNKINWPNTGCSLLNSLRFSGKMANSLNPPRPLWSCIVGYSKYICLPSPSIDFSSVSISLKFGRSCQKVKKQTNKQKSEFPINIPTVNQDVCPPCSKKTTSQTSWIRRHCLEMPSPGMQNFMRQPVSHFVANSNQHAQLTLRIVVIILISY